MKKQLCLNKKKSKYVLQTDMNRSPKTDLPRPILLRVRWTAGGALSFLARVARQRPSPSWRESKTFTVDGSTGYRRPTRPPSSQYARVHHSLCPVSPVNEEKKTERFRHEDC